MWPASALLTGNGVAFILRVPGTAHGDWWSMRGWWIFAGTAAVSLLSKYVITWRGGHVFNPSNFGLVLCFLLLAAAPRRAARLLVGADVGVARAGVRDHHRRRARDPLAAASPADRGQRSGSRSRRGSRCSRRPATRCSRAGTSARSRAGHFWWVLLTSPEILVFLFFMITDPKTAPRGGTARVIYAASVGLLAALMIAPMRTEYASKVALLSALAVVCAARPLLALLHVERLRSPDSAVPRGGSRARSSTSAALVGAGRPAHSTGDGRAARDHRPAARITILPSRGVESQLDMPDRPRDRTRPRHRPARACRDRRPRPALLASGGGQAASRRRRRYAQLTRTGRAGASYAATRRSFRDVELALTGRWSSRTRAAGRSRSPLVHGTQALAGFAAHRTSRSRSA